MEKYVARINLENSIERKISSNNEMCVWLKYYYTSMHVIAT